MQQFAEKYKKNLLEDVIPFWENHSLDKECGGYFTCLDRDGQTYDTDKFIWLQARQAYMFAYFYQNLDNRQNWLDIAQHGIEFLSQHGTDSSGNWYFSLNRQGKPLMQPYNIFSDCFAVLAFGQYYITTKDADSKKIFDITLKNIFSRLTNPKGIYNKTVPGTRPLDSLAMPMILLNILSQMQKIIESAIVESNSAECVQKVMNLFIDKDSRLIYENVSPEGGHIDSHEGRLINPGHGLEAMWFILDYAETKADDSLITRAVDSILSTLDFSWDSKYGGIYYFMDAMGRPPCQLEWDMKLWWPHLEALIALAKAYRLTGSDQCRKWFEKIDQYAWSKFPDPQYGEWFGYLHRDGDLSLSLKGGKWKGFFHVPRALFTCWKELYATKDL